jgi:hypothetical protein
MRTDIYTRIVLTVIAACLVWLCALGSGLPVHAQPKPAPAAAERPQPVVIVGWGSVDAQGRVTLTMDARRGNSVTDPQLPVRIVSYPMPNAPLDVRLEYTPEFPMPVGVSRIKRAGDWEPIRAAVEPEGVRARPGQ